MPLISGITSTDDTNVWISHTEPLSSYRKRVRYCDQKKKHSLDYILKHLNPVHALVPHFKFFSIHLYLGLPSVYLLLVLC
jgi:hypothetical protein